VIKPASALNLLNARDFAVTLGTPLNTAFVVSMVGSAFYPSGAPTLAITSRCRDQAITVIRHFAAEHGFNPAYVYTLENPPEGGYGLHANFLVHLSENDHETLRQGLQARFEAVFAWKARDGGFTPFDMTPKILKPADIIRALIYNLKGIDNVHGTYSRAGFEGPRPQGTIFGKRVGCSQNLDRGARREARHIDTAKPKDLNANDQIRDWRTKRDAEVKEKIRAFFLRTAVTPSS